MYGNNFYGEIDYAGIPVYYVDHTSTLNDSVVVTGTIGFLNGKSLVDTISTSETIAKLGTFVRTLSDTVIVTSTITTVATLFRTLSDTITLVETMTKKTTKILADSLNLADVMTKIGTFVRTLSDSVTLVSSISIAKSMYRTLSDTVIAVDAGITKLVGKVVSDTFSVADVIRRYLNGLLVGPWSKITKSTATFVKTAKNITKTTAWGSGSYGAFSYGGASYAGVNNDQYWDALWSRVVKATTTFIKIAKSLATWIKSSKSSLTWTKEEKPY